MSGGELIIKADRSGARTEVDLQIHYGIHKTPFGDAVIASTGRGICSLDFLNNADLATVKQNLQRSWPLAEILNDKIAISALAERIFTPSIRPDKPPPIHIAKATDFQLKVWSALLKVPFGETTTYQIVAEMIDHPTAVRAVGNAAGKNPIGYLIPCHRLIRASGTLGGYRWGIERKAAMLNWEAIISH